MKLVRLDLPKAKGRGKKPAAASYFLSQITPQQFYVKLGKGEDAREAAFHRVVKNEPSYASQTPIRGVAQFGGAGVRLCVRFGRRQGVGLQSALLRSQRQRRSDRRSADRRHHGDFRGPRHVAVAVSARGHQAGC